jgi:hypothetical protein
MEPMFDQNFILTSFISKNNKILKRRSNASPSYIDKLRQYYENIEYNAAIPFPDEKSLGITIPENQVVTLGAGSKLTSFLDEINESGGKVLPVVRIIFSEDYGEALALTEYIPKLLIEACLFKINNYLAQYGNNEYILHKLLLQLPGKEPTLRNTLNKMLIKPLECYDKITEGGEFSYLFWVYFGGFIKNDIKMRRDRFNNDNAVIQAVYIIEAVSGYYRSMAVKVQEKELALKKMEQNLAKVPYTYTLAQIEKFSGANGSLLLGQYNREDLSKHLTKMTCQSIGNKLPELLIFSGPENERYFVLKNKMPLLCSKLLAEAREEVKKDISRHWLMLIKDYKTEAAMEDDREFEKALIRYTEKFCPMLNFLLDDPKMQMVYDEMEQIKMIIPFNKILVGGDQISYSALFRLKRKDLLEDIRIFLPFWYSIPVLVVIIAFYKRFELLFKMKRPA